MQSIDIVMNIAKFINDPDSFKRVSKTFSKVFNIIINKYLAQPLFIEINSEAYETSPCNETDSNDDFSHYTRWIISTKIPKKHITFIPTLSWIIPDCGYVIKRENILKPSQYNKTTCTCISCINTCNNKNSCMYCKLNLS